jgi:hypothetical protein
MWHWKLEAAAVGLAAKRPERRPAIAPGRLIALALLMTVLPACGGKPAEPEPEGPATFAGTFAGSASGAGVSGSLAVTLAVASAPAPGTMALRAQMSATGTLTLSGGGTVDLAGTYDDATGAVTLEGGGWSVSGTRSGAALSGVVTSPGGIVGGFVSMQAGGTAPRVYCGTYASSTPGGPRGLFNLVVSGATVSGLAVDEHTGEVVVLQGTLAGAGVTILDPNGGSVAFATGTIDSGPDTCAGTYDDGLGDTGTWSAARC